MSVWCFWPEYSTFIITHHGMENTTVYILARTYTIIKIFKEDFLQILQRLHVSERITGKVTHVILAHGAIQQSNKKKIIY